MNETEIERNPNISQVRVPTMKVEATTPAVARTVMTYF